MPEGFRSGIVNSASLEGDKCGYQLNGIQETHQIQWKVEIVGPGCSSGVTNQITAEHSMHFADKEVRKRQGLLGLDHDVLARPGGKSVLFG